METKTVLDIGRVPIMEIDNTTDDQIIFNNCCRFRKMLEELNPDEQFYIGLDDKEILTVKSPATEVAVPERWSE